VGERRPILRENGKPGGGDTKRGGKGHIHEYPGESSFQSKILSRGCDEFNLLLAKWGGKRGVTSFVWSKAHGKKKKKKSPSNTVMRKEKERKVRQRLAGRKRGKGVKEETRVFERKRAKGTHEVAHEEKKKQSDRGHSGRRDPPLVQLNKGLSSDRGRPPPLLEEKRG